MAGWQDAEVIGDPSTAAPPPSPNVPVQLGPNDAGPPAGVPYVTPSGRVMWNADGSATVLGSATGSPGSSAAPPMAQQPPPQLPAAPQGPGPGAIQTAGPPQLPPPGQSPAGPPGWADAAGAPRIGDTPGPAGWSSAPVVNDTPQMAKARQDAQSIVAQTPGWERALDDGASFNLSSNVLTPGLAAIGTGIQNAFNQATGKPGSGYGMSEAFGAVRDAALAASAQYRADHPMAAGVANIGGGLANPASWLGASWVGGAPALGSAIARSIPVGAAMGAAYGAGGSDPQHMAADTIGGAVGGALTAPIAPLAGAALGPVIRTLQRARLPSPTASIPQVHQALASVGMNWADLPVAARAETLGLIQSGKNPADAAIAMAAKHLPVSMPMSMGQITGEPGQQLAENLALRGAQGPNAAIYARDYQAQQQQALRGNVDALKGQLAGSNQFQPGQGGAMVSDALASRYTAAKAGVDAAYDAARAGGPTTLPAYDAKALHGQVAGALTDFDPLSVPRVSQEVGRLGAMTSGRADPDIRDLFASRARLSQLRMSNDPVEAKAAGRAVNAFDKSIDGNLSDDLFHGDPATVAKWKAAIGERREFGRLFQGDDLIEKLTARDMRGGRSQLAVDPHDASNYILGRSGLGFVGRANLYRDLGRLKDVLGPTSPAWNALRAEAFNRFAGSAEGPIEGGSQQFSGVKFQKGWRGAMRQDPQLIDSLFSRDEIGQINQLAGVAARVTAPVKGGDNPSNTAVAQRALAGVVSGLKRLPFMALKSLPLVDHVGTSLDDAMKVGAIRRATEGAAPRSILRPPGAVAGAWGAPLLGQQTARRPGP